jgi:cytochrome c5
MKQTVILSLILVIAGFAYGADKDAVHSIALPDIKTELKAGEGRDTTERYCSVCHSLDYIVMQPKFSKVKWTGIVNKMIKVMGAPIPEEDAKVISDYLGIQYGTGE